MNNNCSGSGGCPGDVARTLTLGVKYAEVAPPSAGFILFSGGSLIKFPTSRVFRNGW